MKKILLALVMLLIMTNVCSAKVYKNAENGFQMDIGSNWELTKKESHKNGLLLVFTALDDKKSTLQVAVSPVIDQKVNATLRDLSAAELNEYYDAFTNMIYSVSPEYSITFADCREIGPHYVLQVNGSSPLEGFVNGGKNPFLKSNSFLLFKKKIFLVLLDSWDVKDLHMQQSLAMIGSLKAF